MKKVEFNNESELILFLLSVPVKENLLTEVKCKKFPSYIENEKYMGIWVENKFCFYFTFFYDVKKQIPGFPCHFNIKIDDKILSENNEFIPINVCRALYNIYEEYKRITDDVEFVINPTASTEGKMIEFEYLDLFNQLYNKGFVCVNCDGLNLSKEEIKYMKKKEITFISKDRLTPNAIANYILKNADEFSYPNNYFLGVRYDNNGYTFSIVKKPYEESEEELKVEIEKLKDEIKRIKNDIKELKNRNFVPEEINKR